MNKLNDWFAGDTAALDLYERLSFISHAWDDLIDRDKEVSDADINALMMNLLFYLPTNPCFKRYEQDIRLLMLCGATSYQAANLMERTGDDHKVEIAHYMRYAISQVVVFMITTINGFEKAPAIIAEAMPTMIPERVADYLKEHTHVVHS